MPPYNSRLPEIPSTIFVSETISPPVRADLDEIRETARQNILKGQERDLRHFEGTQAKVIPFELGSLILKEIDARARLKTDLKYRGIYRITEILPNHRYTITDVQSGRNFKFAHDRLKLITQDASLLPSLLQNESESDQEV